MPKLICLLLVFISVLFIFSCRSKKTVTYYKGNKLVTTNLVNGRKMVEMYDHEKLISIHRYKDSLTDGMAEGFYMNGQRSYFIPYADDKKNGFAVYFDSIYGLKKICFYKNNLRNGYYAEFNQDKSSGYTNYSNGKLNGWLVKYDNDKIKKVELWKNDSLNYQIINDSNLTKIYFDNSDTALVCKKKECERKLWVQDEDSVIIVRTMGPKRPTIQHSTISFYKNRKLIGYTGYDYQGTSIKMPVKSDCDSIRIETIDEDGIYLTKLHR